MEILLNLIDFTLVRYPNENFIAFIETILHEFVKNEMLRKEFVIDWFEGKNTEEMKKHYLYNETTNKKTVETVKNLVNYLKSLLNDEDEDEEAEEEEDEEEEEEEEEEVKKDN
jgi:hypothetical protein